MLKKWLIVLLAWTAGAVLAVPQLAADAHYFFSKELDRLTLHPLEGWAAVLGGGKPLRFYLLFAAALALFLVWFLIEETYLNYNTKLQRITPDIATPMPAGQGQCGTARWMRKKDLRNTFTIWKLRKGSADLQALLQAGKADRKEIQNADIPTE